MSLYFDRRNFIKKASKSTIGIGLISTYGLSEFKSIPPSDKIVVAIVGTNSRGSALAKAFVKTPGIDVAYVCDVDDNAISKGIKAVVEAGQKMKVVGIKDFRSILDDKSVNAIVCGLIKV